MLDILVGAAGPYQFVSGRRHGMPKHSPVQECPGEFRVVRYEVPDFIGDYTCLDYGDPHHPRIAQLREEYGLESVVAGCETEFAGILALKRWVRSRWNYGFSRNFPEVNDGLGLLQAASSGEQFACGRYARVFVDAATALGIPARRVGLYIEDCGTPRDFHIWNIGHTVAEAWSNAHRKWVVMDPDINIHYERDGVPLNALEIRNAWLSGQAEEVVMVQDLPEFVVPDARQVQLARQDPTCRKDYDEEGNRLWCETFLRNRVMDYYARLRIPSRTGTYEWVDKKCLPTFIVRFAPGEQVQWTSNPADVYWTLNMVRMCATPSWNQEGSKLTVTLSHCMPFFDHYEIRVDGGAWKRCEPGFDWPAREGVHSLECRGVNRMDRPGIVSRIDVAYARSPAGSGYF